MMKTVSVKIGIAACMLLLLGLPGCGDTPKEDVAKTGPAPKGDEKSGQEAVRPQFTHKQFPTAAEALAEIVRDTKPRAIGFGEFHQQTKTANILSALERFSSSMLPVLSGKTSDLIVETWVAQGACGAEEKKVLEQVDKVTERPAETENETIRLLKRAKSLGIQPHILEVQCEDYEKVQDPDGGLDYLALLELVARRLKEKGKATLAYRAGKEEKIVALYGGAIHNDADPVEMWKTVSFAPDIKKAVGDQYVEVDIYVPEFIENSNLVSNEPWFPLFKKMTSPDKALLIKLDERSYIIGFPKGVSSPG
ncbi:MAG: hypothetical protein GY854_19465 [Deltaproteobacteria bacterium]|nr:hypothetical protein [Deltaproteobacteria bacterium]